MGQIPPQQQRRVDNNYNYYIIIPIQMTHER